MWRRWVCSLDPRQYRDMAEPIAFQLYQSARELVGSKASRVRRLSDPGAGWPCAIRIFSRRSCAHGPGRENSPRPNEWICQWAQLITVAQDHRLLGLPKKSPLVGDFMARHIDLRCF